MSRTSDIAERHGLDEAAVEALDQAVRRGGGRQAQFNHPGLGGHGQWMSSGMTQIGQMGDHDLKARVAAAAHDLATSLDAAAADHAADSPARADDESGEPTVAPRRAAADEPARARRAAPGDAEPSGSDSSGSDSWPGELGRPASSGSQDGQAYAVFPDAHRLAVREGGRVRVFDTGEHRISGAGQQQGSVDRATWRTSQGEVRLADLREV